MIELPETFTIAKEINNTILGKRIANVVANHTTHKFAWFFGDPQNYKALLMGKIIDSANSYGGLVEIKAGDAVILLGDGVGLRFHSKDEERPKKHQLLIEFEDFSSLSASVQMYGGLWCFKEGEFDNPYYKFAKEKPSPLTKEFDKAYFLNLISMQDIQKLSAKAFLTTEQRIPGLGNGVLQDILYAAKIHPKKKVNTFSDQDKEKLFYSIKSVLEQMVLQGGRDTEKDLFGHFGGYKTKLSKNTVNTSCAICGDIIRKENYLGGSIYYCDSCQVRT
ncbi:MAG: glycosylase/AP lyase, DNA-binding [Clostridiales bacterium]|jgi:formamidopyrimidine-DNA glycosylase|nr:glycosylase/AP lyase, DNA-binding [Clostridiales bacterium]